MDPEALPEGVEMSTHYHANLTDPARPTKKKIDVKNLAFWYGDFNALANVTVDVKSQAITAFIGPSGCGKIDIPALHQPHERPHPRRACRGLVLLSTAQTSTHTMWRR